MTGSVQFSLPQIVIPSAPFLFVSSSAYTTVVSSSSCLSLFCTFSVTMSLVELCSSSKDVSSDTWSSCRPSIASSRSPTASVPVLYAIDPRRMSDMMNGSFWISFDAVIVIPSPGPLFASFTLNTPLVGTIVSVTSNPVCSVSRLVWQAPGSQAISSSESISCTVRLYWWSTERILSPICRQPQLETIGIVRRAVAAPAVRSR